MIDFQAARKTMVDCQIRPNDVTDHNILDAFMDVPREAFVTAAKRSLAYIDEDILLSHGETDRYLMEAMTLSKLIQLAAPTPDCIALDIGCATGYSTAILSKLCNSVVALESDAALAEQAGQKLLDLGYDNAVVVNGALEAGYAKEGPYDVILVGGAVDETPKVLTSQLKDNGRLVVVEGRGNSGVAKLYSRQGDIVSERVAFNSAVMPLPGFSKKEEFVF